MQTEKLNVYINNNLRKVIGDDYTASGQTPEPCNFSYERILIIHSQLKDYKQIINYTVKLQKWQLCSPCHKW